jgi:serine protease Do
MASLRRWSTRTGLIVGLIAGAIGGALPTAVAVEAQAPSPRPLQLDRSFLGGGGQLGINVRDVTEADAESQNLPGMAGAVVETVRPGSPAASAGLRPGDIVLTFDGERVRSARHLVRLLDETPALRDVEVTVQRNGDPLVMDVTPEPAVDAMASRRLFADPDILLDRLVMPKPFASEPPANTARLGVGVQDLTEQLRGYFGVARGVLVTSVEAGSVAATAGVRAGDVIGAFNDTPISTVAGLRRSVAQASGEITITVTRDRRLLTLKGTLPAIKTDGARSWAPSPGRYSEITASRYSAGTTSVPRRLRFPRSSNAVSAA